MNRKEWEAIGRARALLDLGEKATRDEIRNAYRRLCKRHHPDTSRDEESREVMYRLTAAYELLMRYCDSYRFPLLPPEGDIYDAEDWWMHRFGQDPLWGRKR